MHAGKTDSFAALAQAEKALAFGDPDPEVVERLRQLPVEAVGLVVAVHHAPPDEPAAGLLRRPADLGQQRTAEPLAAMGRPQIEIVEEAAALARLRVIGLVEQGVARRRALDLGDHAGKCRPQTEAVAPKILFVEAARRLVFRPAQLNRHGNDRGGVARARGSDVDRHADIN